MAAIPQDHLQEFYQPALRRMIYSTFVAMQADLEWPDYYNNERTKQGKECCGRAPMQTLEDVKSIWKEKIVN